MNTYQWYEKLVKPSWAPDPSLFGKVWTVLYLFITLSFGYVFLMVYRKTIPSYVAIPFALNLFFNAIFTPIQFGLRNNWLAVVDIVLVLITIIWCMVSIYPFAKWVSFIQIPYLLWVCIATALQISITYLNR